MSPHGRRFLILHGVENWRPRGHWQWWLTAQLRDRGEQVLYPQLPRPSSPALDEWLSVLHGELAQLGDGERVVVAHSAGALLWLLACPELALNERVDRVALVAPPSPSMMAVAYPALLPIGLDAIAVRGASTERPFVVTSDDDPYCPEGLATYRALYTDALGLPHHVVPGAGHLSIDDGYGPWPEMLDWCLTGTAEWNRSGAVAH